MSDVNTSTVFNAALNLRQFWNGCADSLEAQVPHVVQNPVEMGSNWQEVVQKVSRDNCSQGAFAAAYKDGITKSNIQNAIATYVLERPCHARRTLVNYGTITTPCA